jgi:hypothetical protein
MAERKPPQVEFFLPGTSEKEVERLQTLADATQKEVVAETANQAPVEQDDPDALLDAFVRQQAPLIDGKVDVDVAHEAKQARHNTHLTQLRMIELEKRRQRRAKRGEA